MKYFVNLLFISSLLFALPSLAKSPIYTGYFSNDAVSGYDSVAYFTQSKAIKGSEKFKHKYKGKNWYFSSQAHLELFTANPIQYAPQYGGYCAYAVAKNTTASADPEQWNIENGKLYLNYNQDIKHKWSDNKINYIKNADQNWPKLIN